MLLLNCGNNTNVDVQDSLDNGVDSDIIYRVSIARWSDLTISFELLMYEFPMQYAGRHSFILSLLLWGGIALGPCVCSIDL